MVMARTPGASHARIVLAVWLAWSSLTALPFLLAELRPPPGRWFAGAFDYQDDYFQYLSFLEQASRGAVLFENKFDLTPHGPFLVNLEWWAGGTLSRLIGGRTSEAFHVLGWLAAGLLVAGAARLLVRGGRRGGDLAWALALVLLGGGLGWWRSQAGVPSWQIADLSMTLFPSSQRLVGSTHSVVGTGLLVWCLVRHLEWRLGQAHRRAWLGPAVVLGLCRPFDLGLFVLVALALLFTDVARGGSLRSASSRGLELIWLLPLLLYEGLVFGLHPAFATWAGSQNTIALPPVSELAWALGPALAAGLVGLAWPAPSEEARSVRRGLLCLIAVVVGLVVTGQIGWAAQLTNGLGGVMLLLAAVSVPARALPLLTLALLPSSAMLFHRALNPDPRVFPPLEYALAAKATRASCTPRDLLAAPEDFGLVVAAFSPCRVVVGHRILTPDYAERSGEVARLYDARTPSDERRRYLQRIGATFVLVPAGQTDWLGTDAGHSVVLTTSRFEVWALDRAP